MITLITDFAHKFLPHPYMPVVQQNKPETAVDGSRQCRK